MALLPLVLLTSPALVVRPPASTPAAMTHTRGSGRQVTMQGGALKGREPFSLSLDLGKTGKGTLRFKPSVLHSEAVVVRYKVPFGLNVENQNGRAICTKDGPGGERVGDILRYTTYFSMQLPGGEGVVDTVASFGGMLSWKMGLFDVDSAKSWEEVVDKLVSNTPERTDEVVLVFERPIQPE